jgi:predicted esterase
VDVRTIETATHGRYLVRSPAGPGPSPLRVGFHGYRESAAAHLDKLAQIPGADRWLIVAVQALHRFYEKSGDVVASWMTKEDRELAIADNVAYVGRVLAAVRAEYVTRAPLVFAGFSQGVAMAFRAAASQRADGLIAIAADVPPDVLAGATVALPPVLYARGTRDGLYSAEQHEKDLQALAGLRVPVERVTFEGGHEWTPELLNAAGRMLAAWDPTRG